MNDLIFPSSSPVTKRGIRSDVTGCTDQDGGGNGLRHHRSPNADDAETMEAPLKELERLQKLVSDEPSMGKSKTPAIQDSLNSLLQTLHVQKKRLEAGLATEAELTTLARTAEARKKEIDERQKEIYNSLARYGKALDKVRWLFVVWFRLGGFVELTGLRVGVEIYDAVADLRASFCFEGGPELFGTCHRYAFPQDGAILYGRDVCAGTYFPQQREVSYA